MPTKLTIRDLKNIKSLEFEIPEPGAYLLTGTNGSGKTSLLTCLSRLRNRNSFQRGFRSSFHPSLDSHRGASVKYEINGQSVIYTYVEERWAPLPRRNSGLLATCGYPAVAYIAADADRVQPQEQEFTPRSVRLTNQSLRDEMSAIFSTDRFSELCYLNLNRGGAEKAYLIRQPQPNNKAAVYFSERNFSLGELCVLKLLLALEGIPNSSLVLIDELELATHPRAQTQLFVHLNRISQEKNLTIIFSTHSVSLIKGTDRNQVLFLENSNGIVSCTRGCYPTYTLGHISSGEEVAPDCVVYVEDDSAQKCLKAMLELYRQQTGLGALLPTTLAIPLGGFRQILEFLDKAPQMLPRHTKLMVALDNDVEQESLVDYRAINDHAMLALFGRLKKHLVYLPWTPEVGLVELIRADITSHEAKLKAYFSDHRIVIPQNWGAVTQGLSKKPLRVACKKVVYELGQSLETLLGRPNDRIREDLFRYLVLQTHEAQQHDLVSFVGSLIHQPASRATLATK